MIEGLPVDRGPLDGWVTLEALAADRFDMAEAYFAAAEAGAPGLDRRGQGAYFVGGVTYYLAVAIADHWLREGAVPDITAKNFGVHQGAVASDLLYRMADGVGTTSRPIGEVMETAISGLVERVRLTTRLAEPAQWRLAADGVAGAFLLLGKARGCSDRAQEMAMSVVRDPRFKPFNGHTGYHRLSETEVFLKRGGCCRYYTSEGGSYCATCVLRPPEEQLQQLAAARDR